MTESFIVWAKEICACMEKDSIEIFFTLAYSIWLDKNKMCFENKSWHKKQAIERG